VTNSSTWSGAKPGASVWISTCVGTKSGNTSNGARAAPRQPRTRASKLSAVAAPKCRMHSETNQRMSVLGRGAGVQLPSQQRSGARGHHFLSRRDPVTHEVSFAERAARVDGNTLVDVL